MWDRQNTFDADMSFAARLVLTGNATPEQAAALCGLPLEDLQALLQRGPQLKLQEVERTR